MMLNDDENVPPAANSNLTQLFIDVQYFLTNQLLKLLTYTGSIFLTPINILGLMDIYYATLSQKIIIYDMSTRPLFTLRAVLCMILLANVY